MGSIPVFRNRNPLSRFQLAYVSFLASSKISACPESESSFESILFHDLLHLLDLVIG